MCEHIKRALIVAVFSFFILIGVILAGPSTNDIDRLFVHVCSTNILELYDSLYDVNTNLLRVVDADALALRRHALGRLLSIPVTTNSWGFRYIMREKAELIGESENLLGMHFVEDDVRTVLDSLRSFQPISTNDLERLRREAAQRDEDLYGHQTWGASWIHRKNMTEWRNCRARLIEWNASATAYREDVVAAMVKVLNRIWRDVPEVERRRRIQDFIASFGLGYSDRQEVE